MRAQNPLETCKTTRDDESTHTGGARSRRKKKIEAQSQKRQCFALSVAFESAVVLLAIDAQERAESLTEDLRSSRKFQIHLLITCESSQARDSPCSHNTIVQHRAPTRHQPATKAETPHNYSYEELSTNCSILYL